MIQDGQVDTPRLVTPTLAELKASAYDSPNIEAALEGLHQDGFVVLKSVVDVAHIDRLNVQMSKEADDLLNNNLKPFNQGIKSNILQAPPLTDPGFLFNDVYFNPFVIQVMNAYLGARPIWNFLTGNNALPRTSGIRQPVHKDITFSHPQCPFFVIVNVPLCSFNTNTGSTEFWLGSHASTSGKDQVFTTNTEETAPANPTVKVGEPLHYGYVLPELVEKRRQMRPPLQPVCEKGDIMLRDVRTWHAGMPNESDNYRVMLALGYQAQWYENHTLRVKLPLSQGNFFMKHGNQPVEVRADLLPDDSDFVKLNDDFTFRRSVE